MGASSSTPSSSSTTTTSLHTKHDVFLSFSGKHGAGGSFVSHLCDALSQKHIETYVENDGPGDEVSPSSLSAIEACKICLIVFSADYSNSKGCLRELAEIIKLKRMEKIVVIPVFYQIDPSDVRKQIGVFKNAFDKYRKVCREELQMWKEALTQASNVAGWDSSVTRPESRLVDEIVKDVLKKLNDKSIFTDFRGLVGMDSRVEEVNSLLSMETFDFRFVGIWGMGGIGKTTLAGAVFDQISCQFDGCCFVAHVREEAQNCGGLVHLRDKLLSQILGEKLNLGTHIPQLIKRRLQTIRVLIVLDDVSNWEQIETLAGGLDRLGSGSRVVITTRDKQMLKKFVAPNNIYEVKALDNHEALQLFCNCAFKKDPIPEDLMVYARRATDYAKGNPLALKVLGSSLYRKSEQDWESALRKLNKISKPEIHNILRIGYDALDREEKDILLDIGCFFKGEYRDYVIELLKSCYFSVQAALSVLVDKSLVVLLDSEIDMHDLLQEMCWEIVRQESFSKPGERSRLHSHEDVCRVLRRNIVRTESVKGIHLDMSKIRCLDLDSQAFENMNNLRYLKLYDWSRSFGDPTSISKIHLPIGVTSLPLGLRYLSWHGYPSKLLPLKSNVENLVELNLFDSKVEQLWEGKKGAPKLKRLILGHSQQLTRIPDLSGSPDLEVIDLVDCRSLTDISSAVQNLNNLMYLRLSGCESLRSFSNDVHFGSLEVFDVSSCINLIKFPRVSGNIQILNLEGSGIEEVPSSIEIIRQLVILALSDCSELRHISTNICKLKSLQTLELRNCSKLESFPEILEMMRCLQTLDLSGTAIRGLPSSISKLTGLLSLNLRGCKSLDTLPSSIGELTSLQWLDLFDSSKLGNLPVNVRDLSAGRKAEPSQLSSSTCSISLVECLAFWPSSGLSSFLRYLFLNNCNLTEIPEDIGYLYSLEELDLCRNDFESLPSSIKQLLKLETLLVNDCNELQCVTTLPLNLLRFEAMNCKKLQSLPDTPEFVEFITSERSSVTKSGLSCAHLLLTNSPEVDVEAFGNVFQESLQIIQLMAMAGMKVQDDFCVNICYPGSKMPKCFSDQSFGSLANVQSSSLNCSDGILLGCALCAVITFKGYCYAGGKGIPYRCCFQTDRDEQIAIKGEFVVCEISPYRHSMLIDSDHVLLGYYDQSHRRLQTDKFTRCTIEIKVSDDSSHASGSWNLKCCGVFPIYAQA